MSQLNYRLNILENIRINNKKMANRNSHGFGTTLLCNATQAKLWPADNDGFTLDVADCDRLLAIIDASSMLKLLVISSEKKETAELSHNCLQTIFCNLAYCSAGLAAFLRQCRPLSCSGVITDKISIEGNISSYSLSPKTHKETLFIG